MGKSQSKNTNQNGDPQVTVIQNQEQHSVEHDSQSLLLWMILAIVLLQLGITLYKSQRSR